MNELNNAIKELEMAINNKNLSNSTIIQKPLYEVLKNCLKNKKYEVQVGNYTINVNPKELLVSYEDESIHLEVSNEANYEEKFIMNPIEYYVINPSSNNVPGITPSLSIINEVIELDKELYHNYVIELLNSNDDINNYVKNVSKIENNLAIINKKVTVEDTRINVEDYLQMDKVKYAEYKMEQDMFNIVDKKEDNTNYSNIIPTNNDKKEIATFLYKYLINFYKEYLQKNVI